MQTFQIFTPKQCAEIVAAFDANENKTTEGDLKNDPYYRNSLGIYQLPEALQYGRYVTDTIQKVYPNTKFDSVYTRAYHNSSYLLIHTDRPNLDLTLSVCLENNRGYIWDLKISNLSWEGEWDNNADHTLWQKSYSVTHLGIGQGSLCHGRKYPHWRDTLSCQPNERVVYAFYHWTFIEPILKKEPVKNLSREQLALTVLSNLLVDTSWAVADKLIGKMNDSR